KPSTTLGSDAMVSTTGFTRWRRDGCRNCEAYIAERTPSGTASASEYSVPLRVPKISGTSESFVSKSSVPDEDCQANSGPSYPSYQTLPNNAFQPTSGCGASI